MPKPKSETTLSDVGGWKKISVAVGQPDGTTKPAVYTCFSSFDTLLIAVQTAKDAPGSALSLRQTLLGMDSEGDAQESEQALLVRLINASIDRMARSMAYEAAAQQSTFITVGEDKADIMLFPLPRLLRGINGMRAQLDTRMITAEMLAEKESDPAKKASILEAARKDAEKAIRFGPWKTAAKKLVETGKAKENEATGMLEVAA